LFHPLEVRRFREAQYATCSIGELRGRANARTYNLFTS
jgi:hypothetical protein